MLVHLQMACVVLVAILPSMPCARATDYAAGPESYVSVLATLQPGDTLTLSPGYYRHGLRLHGLHGNSNAPIVIQGPSSGDAAVFVGKPGANTVSLAEASHLTIRDLYLDGAHLPVDAVKAEGSKRPVHHITLERLTIVNYDNEQGVIGISTKCPAWGWIIRGNDIVGAGTGLYLGNSDGTAPFFGGLIEDNVVVDTIGYDIEIKHQIERPELPDMPTAPSVTILRNNVFAKSRNASEGTLARPNLLVGHFPVHGTGHSDRYEIVGNILFDNRTEVLFQGEGNVTLARNLLFNPNGDAVVLQPHHDRPRSVAVEENFVAASGRGIAVRGGDPELDQTVARNEVYASEPLQGGKQHDNKIGVFAQAKAAVGGWLVQSRKRDADGAMARSRLASLAARACKLIASSGDAASTPSETPSGHPLCLFLRSLSSAAP